MDLPNSSPERDEAVRHLPAPLRHRLLVELAEAELAAIAGRQEISPAAEGSGLCDVSRRHDRYLTEHKD